MRTVRSFLKENANASANDIVSALTSAQESVKVLFSRDRIRIFAKVACVPDKLDPLLKHADVFAILTEAERSLEHFLVAVMEEVYKDDYQMFPLALAHLYEADVVDEETILDWSSDCWSRDRLVSSEEHNAVRASAEPLISWLQQEED